MIDKIEPNIDAKEFENFETISNYSSSFVLLSSCSCENLPFSLSPTRVKAFLFSRFRRNWVTRSFQLARFNILPNCHSYDWIGWAQFRHNLHREADQGKTQSTRVPNGPRPLSIVSFDRIASLFPRFRLPFRFPRGGGVARMEEQRVVRQRGAVSRSINAVKQTNRREWSGTNYRQPPLLYLYLDPQSIRQLPNKWLRDADIIGGRRGRMAEVASCSCNRNCTLLSAHRDTQGDEI